MLRATRSLTRSVTSYTQRSRPTSSTGMIMSHQTHTSSKASAPVIPNVSGTFGNRTPTFCNETLQLLQAQAKAFRQNPDQVSYALTNAQITGQLKNGFMHDTTEVKALGDVINGSKRIAQTIISIRHLAAPSVCTGRINKDQLAQLTKSIQQGELKGISQFWGPVDAFAQSHAIHPRANSSAYPSWACSYQTAVPYCPKTGKATHDHRSSLVIIQLTDELLELPVVVSKAVANETRIVHFDEKGYKVENLGPGGGTQLYFPEMLGDLHINAILHPLATHVVHQDHQGQYGISRRDSATGKWAFKGVDNSDQTPIILPPAPVAPVASKPKLNVADLSFLKTEPSTQKPENAQQTPVAKTGLKR